MYLTTVGNPEYDTYMLLRQTNQLIEKLISRRCRMNGLTAPGLEVLYTVMAGPKPMSAYLLARILGREHHSVVEIVNRLKAKGFIIRKTINGKPSLSVTAEGAEIAAKILSTPIILPVFEALGRDNIQKLRDSLMPLRAEAMHDLGLLDLGEMQFTAVDEVVREASGRGTNK